MGCPINIADIENCFKIAVSDTIHEHYREAIFRFFFCLLSDSISPSGYNPLQPNSQIILTHLFENLFLLLHPNTLCHGAYSLIERGIFLYNLKHEVFIGISNEKMTVTNLNWYGKPLLLSIALYSQNEIVASSAMKLYSSFHVNVCVEDLESCCQEMISVCLKVLVESNGDHLFNRSLSLLQVFYNYSNN